MLHGSHALAEVGRAVGRLLLKCFNNAANLHLQELLSQLEDSVQNVSAKAMSSEVICAANQAKLESFETKIRDFDLSRAAESRRAGIKTRP